MPPALVVLTLPFFGKDFFLLCSLQPLHLLPLLIPLPLEIVPVFFLLFRQLVSLQFTDFFLERNFLQLVDNFSDLWGRKKVLLG